MALPDLAASADLSARGVDVSDTGLVATMLTVASATVRQAAASPILETASTVTVWAHDSSDYLNLPGQPVTAVSAVVYDGDTLDATDYKLVDGRLWRWWGWGCMTEPIEVTVSMTHGLAEVPADIVQLVCDLAIAGMGAATEGALDPRVIAEKVDDYSVTYRPGAESVATAVELPALTKRGLRARFGGGAGMVTYR